MFIAISSVVTAYIIHQQIFGHFFASFSPDIQPYITFFY